MAKSEQAAAPILEPFRLERFLPFRLSVLSNRLTRRVARFYGERYRLSAPEWRVMAVLGESGSLSANAVVERTTMDKVRVSRAIAKLMKSDFLTRRSDPGDRRRAVLDLTAKGQITYRHIVPLVQRIEAEILEVLSSDERIALNHALGKIEMQIIEGGVEPDL